MARAVVDNLAHTRTRKKDKRKRRKKLCAKQTSTENTKTSLRDAIGPARPRHALQTSNTKRATKKKKKKKKIKKKKLKKPKNKKKRYKTHSTARTSQKSRRNLTDTSRGKFLFNKKKSEMSK